MVLALAFHLKNSTVWFQTNAANKNSSNMGITLVHDRSSYDQFTVASNFTDWSANLPMSGERDVLKKTPWSHGTQNRFPPFELADDGCQLSHLKIAMSTKRTSDSLQVSHLEWLFGSSAGNIYVDHPAVHILISWAWSNPELPRGAIFLYCICSDSLAMKTLPLWFFME